MGFNTPVVFHNDVIHQMKDDPKAGEKIYNAILQSDRVLDKRGQLLFATQMPYGMVLPSYHADMMRMLVVGGNTGVQLSAHVGRLPLTDEDAVEALEFVANRYGYRLEKRRDII